MQTTSEAPFAGEHPGKLCTDRAATVEREHEMLLGHLRR